MNISEMTGLEILEAMANGDFPYPPMANTMNILFRKVERGSLIFTAVAEKAHLNPMGGVHGGFACTVLDSATGCAVHTMLKAGESYGTIDINVKMMRPIPLGKTVLAKAKVINLTKSLGVSEGRIEDEEGKLYAYASCTCKIIQA